MSVNIKQAHQFTIHANTALFITFGGNGILSPPLLPVIHSKKSTRKKMNAKFLLLSFICSLVFASELAAICRGCKAGKCPGCTL